jgi:hypothetical protein
MKSNICLVLILLLTTASAFTELPHKIDPFIYCVPSGLNYGYTKPYGKIYGFPTIRIFGWSKDGKIAYSLQRNIEGRGGVITNYIIQDLVTDSILWKFDDDSFKWDVEIDNIDLITEKSFTSNQKLLEDNFNKYQIIQDNITYLNISDLQNIGLTMMLNITDNGTDSIGFKNINYKITAKTKNNKTKIITNRSNITADNVYICGYCKSPFEERIAIIIAEEKYVFEGNELFYDFVGCLTDVGYK